jgi:limonene-1,2-epoxide hydrolase
MTDIATVSAWVTAYRTAWQSNLDADIRALFTDDGDYRFTPSDEPVHGIDAIVATWLSRADAADDTTFSWQVIGIDGDLAFVQGRVDYTDGQLYDNLWVIRFAADGRATSFTEWWMKRPGSK